MSTTALSERRQDILRAITEAGRALSPKEIAERCDWEYQSVRVAVRDMLKDGLLVQPSYGLYDVAGQGDGAKGKPPATAEREISPSLLKEEVVTYTYRPVGDRAEAGAGADNEYPDHENTELMVRSRAELARFGLGANSLRAFFVAGNSMETEIRANTPALYLPMENFEASGIYVITLDDLTQVKVVELLAAGAFKMSSLNKELYPEAELMVPLEDADSPNMYRSQLTGLVCRVKVEGRVVLYTKTT